MKVMKIFKITIIALVVTLLPLTFFAQDCSDFFKFRRPESPWTYSSMSKSALCLTGNKYEFVLPLTKGNDFRLAFYASPIFNNQIQFKIIDQSSGKPIIDLPGEVEGDKPYSCVLKDFFDEKSGKQTHPTFDFFPETTVNLKIVIEVKPVKHEPGTPETKERGCITVMVLNKPAAGGGF
jgi:hypothetical protein